MEVDSTSFEEVIRIPWVKSIKKDVIPERTITVGYNGPTKCQCGSRGNVERYKAKDFRQKNKMMRTFTVSCKVFFKNHNGVSRALRFEIISDR